jgi:hypothetical protein
MLYSPDDNSKTIPLFAVEKTLIIMLSIAEKGYRSHFFWTVIVFGMMGSVAATAASQRGRA